VKKKAIKKPVPKKQNSLPPAEPEDVSPLDDESDLEEGALDSDELY
jgi:hypothetical protein